MPIPSVPSQIATVLASKLYNAAWSAPGSNEEKITAAVAACKADGMFGVVVPLNMLPYDPSLVTFDTAVRMFREGGNWQEYDVVAYGGKQAATGSISLALRQAVKTAVANGGGVVSIQDPLASMVVLDSDLANDIAAYDRTPLTFKWGPVEVRYTAKQTMRSHHHHVLDGTTFVQKDFNGTRVSGITALQFDDSTVAIGGSGNGVVTSDGSAVVTKVAPTVAAWGALEVGSPISVFGFVPPIGHDNTTINIGGGINSSTTSITVASTTGFPSSGYIRIEDEVINYTSTDATHFLGCTRGFQGTTAASHADTTAVERCVYKPFYVKSISGNDITLDDTIDFAAANCQIRIGALDVSLTGVGVIDGNKDPSVDDTANPYGFQVLGGRYIRVGPGVVFKNHDHGGFDLEQCTDCDVDAKLDSNGRIPTLGSGGWLFGWNKRINVAVDAVECNIGFTIDDRSTTPTLRDGPSENCTVTVRSAINCPLPLEIAGCRFVHASVLIATGISSSTAALGCKATQWITNGTPNNNVGYVGQISGGAGIFGVELNAGWANGNNTFKVMTPVITGGNTMQDGNSLETPDFSLFLTYSATITPRPDRAETMRFAATDTNAITIANPGANTRTRDRRLTFIITNSSGGAMGAITWSADFQLAGAFTNPANGKTRKITFRWNEGAVKWQEESRTAADMP